MSHRIIPDFNLGTVAKRFRTLKRVKPALQIKSNNVSPHQKLKTNWTEILSMIFVIKLCLPLAVKCCSTTSVSFSYSLESSYYVQSKHPEHCHKLKNFWHSRPSLLDCTDGFILLISAECLNSKSSYSQGALMRTNDLLADSRSLPYFTFIYLI